MPGGPRALVRPGSGPHGYESSQGTSECPFDSRRSGAVWGEGMQTILANFQNLERLKLTPTYKNKKDWLFFCIFVYIHKTVVFRFTKTSAYLPERNLRPHILLLFRAPGRTTVLLSKPTNKMRSPPPPHTDPCTSACMPLPARDPGSRAEGLGPPR